MKHFRMLAAGLCSAVLLCGFAIPAYAYSDSRNEESPVVEETPAPEMCIRDRAWSQTAHAPDGEQPEPEASSTSGQSVPKSKFRKKSQQEQAAAAKLRMESQGEKLEQAREKLAKQKPPKKPGPVKRIGRVASCSVHSFVHGKIFEVEQENVGTEGAHRSELVGETALRHGSRFVPVSYTHLSFVKSWLMTNWRLTASEIGKRRYSSSFPIPRRPTTF